MVDRVIVYVDENPLDTDFLNAQKNMMIGLGMALQAIVGTATLVDGLACTPTSPASLQVLMAPGSIMSLENVDGTAYGSLAADTTHQIVKQGINLGTLTLPTGSTYFAVPSTTGYSINYLIEAAYEDVDTGSTVLPYYDASNPSVAYSGPNNTGVSQNTIRQGQCVIAIKAGTAATTGTQTTPAPDAGYTGLWVVTIANGATTITSGNISEYSGAPFIVNKLTALAPLASPPLTGVPTAPTASPGTNTTQLATTAFVQAAAGSGGRTILTGNTNYYVNGSTGNDSTGTGASGFPWATIQHAINYVQQKIDLGGFTATINVADGTYTGGVALNLPFVGGQVILQGNTASPSSCIISTTSADCIQVGGAGVELSVEGFTLETTTSGNGISIAGDGYVQIIGNMNFGVLASGGAHINAFGDSHVFINTNYTISGSANAHMNISQASSIIKSAGSTTTLTGTPAFAQAFINCVNNSYLEDTGTTYSGSATGQRFAVSNNASINTNGSGGGAPTYYPGSIAGTGTNAGTSPFGLYT